MAENPLAERRPAYAFAALAAISIALWVVVTVASARAPSATPFLAAGAAGAGAGAAGLVLQLAKPRLKLGPVLRAAAVIAVALAIAMPAGAVKYTYGGTGSVAVSMSFSPVTLEHGATTPFAGTIVLVNDGSTTVRVRPHFEVRVTDPTGFVLPFVWDGCAIPQPAPPTERDLVELAPGGTYEWPFRQPVAWSDQSARADCGAVLVSKAGTHRVSGFFSSASFDAFALVPVWAGTLSTDGFPVDVH